MQQNLSDTSRTLWIADLDTWMDEPYLQSLIGSLGYSKQLSSVKVIKDKITGQPLKYGFLEFVNHQSAKSFLLNYNKRTIPNTTKQFKLDWGAYSSGTTKKASTSKHSQQQQEMQIYIGELDPSVTEHRLLEFFKMRYPTAFNAKVITDPATKISRGFGFVKFSNSEQASKAITQMNGQSIMGKPFKVSTAQFKKKEEAQVENEEPQSQLLLRQKLYAQFYNSINDPQVKAQYEKQMIKTFGSEQNIKKLTLKQSLEGVRSLTYNETRSSMKMLDYIPKNICNQWHTQMEKRIYQ